LRDGRGRKVQPPGKILNNQRGGRLSDHAAIKLGAMIVLIDNYDSFTYNLVQKLGEVSPGTAMKVFRNDKVTVEEVEALKPTHIVISPGPCTPREGGVSNDIIKYFASKLPVLGVCLGHQCIGFNFGAEVVRAEKLMHGKTD